MGTTSKLTMTGLVGALAAAMVLSASGPASADPPADTYPTLAGTGSDTTQFVLDGLADVIPALGSYDAVDPLTGQTGTLIRTTAGGVQFNRPNGSGAGVKALTASINPTGTYTWAQTLNGVTTRVSIEDQLDFSRSSSGPAQGTGSTALTYIPFALDAVGYAYSDFGDASVPSNLTIVDLQNIYKGALTSYTGADGLSHSYVPRLPQANSGTRAFFLGKLGLSTLDVSWISDLVQENDGSEIDAVGEIVPFSVASWIAQNNGVAPNTIADNDVVLGAIDDDFLGVVSPVDGGKLNTAFPLTRRVFNVVETSRLTTTGIPEDTLLQDTFKGASSAVCTALVPGTSVKVIERYGFGTIGSDCGDWTTASYKTAYVAP